MHLRSLVVPAVLLTAFAGAASAADTRHYEGAITVLEKNQGWMVVCVTHEPFTCNKVGIYGGTRSVVFGSNKPTALARGEYVDVETRNSPAGPVATLVKVHPDQIVRSVRGLKPADGGRVGRTLRSLHGVTEARVLGDLGEVVIRFKPGMVAPPALEKAAQKKGIKLDLPG